MSDQLRDFLATARARGDAAGARVLPLDELRPQTTADAAAEPWGLPALRGRLVELSAYGARATLTAATGLVLEAQTAAEPAAWIFLPAEGSFYPPDVADSGVDLAALVVIRAADAGAAARAAERLLRSGAFGLVVIDLRSGDLSMAQQGRLVSLAQAHDAAVVCLTDKPADAASLGSLVSLRAEAMRVVAPRTSSLAAPDVRMGDRGGYEVTVRALKDKRRGPGWTRKLKARGPAGL